MATHNQNDPATFRVDPGSTIEDVDLDQVEVRLPDGRRLTEPLATALAEQTLTRGVGRPSLTAPGEQSPQLAVRVPVELTERVRVRAAAEGKRTSDIIREALEHYV
jgi:hypothetical protein